MPEQASAVKFCEHGTDQPVYVPWASITLAPLSVGVNVEGEDFVVRSIVDGRI